MADIPKEAPPVLEEDLAEYDGSCLDVILNEYNVDQIPRLAITLFRTRYLPYMARNDLDDAGVNAGKLQWQTEVSINNRLPVFIVDDVDKEKILYRVPPTIGTVHTGITAHEQSMNTLDKFEETQKMRLARLGLEARKMKFAIQNPNSSSQRAFQLDWIRILYDFGYHKELFEVLGEGPYPDDVAEIIGGTLDPSVVTAGATPSGTGEVKSSSPGIGLYQDDDIDD